MSASSLLAFDDQALPTYKKRITRGFSGNLIAGSDLDNLIFRDFSLDMGTLATGHGIALEDSHHITVKDFKITGIGDPGTSAGTGVLVVTTTSTGKGGPWNDCVDVRDGVIEGAAGASRSYGVILEYARYSSVDNIVGGGLTRWVTEFKHDTKFSRQSNIIGYDSAYAIGSGQSDPDVNGSDYNLYCNVISAHCDSAAVFGEAQHNLINGLLVDMRDGPGFFSNKRAIEFQKWCTDNAAFAVATHGTLTTDNPLRIVGPRNFVQIAAFDASSVIVRYEAPTDEGDSPPATARNVVHIAHPGARANMNGAVEDLSGSTGADKNILISPATGEFFGTMSGRFHWRVEDSGATFSTAQVVRFENDVSYTIALGIPGTSGQTAGLAVNSAGVQRAGEFGYNFGASTAADSWRFRVNATDVVRVYYDRMRPVTDNAYALGEAALRFSTVFATKVTTTTINLTEIAAASVSTPAAGSQTIFIDSADHVLKYKNSSGTVTAV